MRHDRLIVTVLFALVPCLVLNWRETKHPEFEDILARIRHECDPANPEADYYWSQRSMPTERKREAIIEDCRALGASLLPEIRRELEREMDDEVRGMLVVTAAALGDADFVEPAAREMIWSDFPAVRISAAKTLRRLEDPRAFRWLLDALDDDHFVVNGGCGTLREKFYPVRSLARLALRDLAARHPEDRPMQSWTSLLEGMPASATFDDVLRRMREEKLRKAEEIAKEMMEAYRRQQKGL
ncbi:MAG: HEAT repeat domain-containing protein [Verrucomicrobiaceae bacterium]|nr:HEAT repeat domain-containing protein [Verrucomicrobiaceae bacterium]